MKNLNSETLKRGMINLKIYFDRARMYLGYINFFMLNVVLLNSSEDGAVAEIINQNRLFWIPVLFVFYAGVLVLVGYFDTKLGIRSEEMRNNAVTNPVIMEMVKSLREIKKNTANHAGSSLKNDT